MFLPLIPNLSVDYIQNFVAVDIFFSKKTHELINSYLFL